MGPHLIDITLPSDAIREESPPQKRAYSTPTLTIFGSAAECPEAARAFDMADVEPAADDPDALLRAYRAAVEREALAWQAVGMQLPGERGFNPKAWHRWERASLAERHARLKWEAAAAASNQSDFAQLLRYIR